MAMEDPLLNPSQAELVDIVPFVDQYGLRHDLDIFQKAAYLVQDAVHLDQIPNITNAEVKALRSESQHKWRQPFLMYLCIVATALGSIGQGWAQVGINGANLYYPDHFNIGSPSSDDRIKVGFINSAMYLSVGLIGTWLVLPLNNILGRRGAIFAGAVVSLIFNIAGSQARSWHELLIARLALGVGLGIISSTLNVFLAECAPAAIRGGLAVAWQMFCAFGIFLGFGANMLVDQNPEAYGPLRWRIMLMVAALPTLPLLVVIWFCPESPAWFVKHSEKYDRTYTSLCSIRNTKLQAARDLLVMYIQRRTTTKTAKETPYIKALFELFTVPRIRRATLAAYTTMLAQIICGINIVAFYSSTIFVEANFSPYAAELASTIFGLVNFLGAFPAIWTMDSFGRRSLLLYTLPPMAISMALAGIGFSMTDPKIKFGLISGMIYLFCLLYSPGMGPVPTTYSAEVFPLSHRELGTPSAIAVANLCAAVLSLTFPWLLSVLGTQGSFLLYAGLNIVGWALVFLFVPETKKRTLEELDQVFSVPTGRFIKYNLRKLLRKDERRPNPAQYTVLEQDDE